MAIILFEYFFEKSSKVKMLACFGGSSRGLRRDRHKAIRKEVGCILLVEVKQEPKTTSYLLSANS